MTHIAGIKVEQQITVYRLYMQGSNDAVSMADGEWITALGCHFLLGP